MWDIRLEFLTGVMLGLEFPDPKEIHEDMSFAMVIDLFVLRISIAKWIRED